MVRAIGGTATIRTDAVEAAFAAVARIDRLMSAHDPASEVSALNRLACQRAIAVSPETRDVLALAQHLHSASDGLFDVAVARAMIRAGVLPNAGIPGDGTTADIDICADGTVRFARPLRIDLGGIAKGFAVDRAVECLRDAGLPAGFVAAGGDLRVFGRVEQVSVRHPGAPTTLLPLLELSDAAVATSAGYYSPLGETRRGAAIVHPRTGRFTRRTVSVTVVAPTCVIADALTKVVFLAGSAAASLLPSFSASAAIVDESGHVQVIGGSHAA